jgi:hypothetical protein
MLMENKCRILQFMQFTIRNIIKILLPIKNGDKIIRLIHKIRVNRSKTKQFSWLKPSLYGTIKAISKNLLEIINFYKY